MRSQNCNCEFCNCGPNCKCTEEVCHCSASQILHSTRNLGTKRTVKLSVSGMTCTQCSKSIETALLNLNGIHEAKVNLIDETASISYDEDKISVSDMIEQIEAIGYEASQVRNSEQTTVHVSGMTCSMCSQAIERALAAVEGVESATVDLTQDTATVTHRGVSIEALTEAIEDVGYTVEGVVQNTTEAESPTSTWEQLVDRQAQKVRERRNAFLGSVVGAAPILFITMILPLFAPHALEKKIVGIDLDFLILFVLATPVQFVAGWEFYRMAYFNLKNQSAGMDVLVALGTSASYGYALVFQMPHFFETSAVLIAFVLLGKYLQALAVRQTSRALQQLMELQPREAIVIDGTSEKVVPISQVKRNDIVKILQGSAIPADGTLVENEISVDESMVTGESIPVLKTVGTPVLGGTICVETGSSGAGLVRVTGVGSDTALAKIVQLVQEAQTRAVPIQSFADQVASIFVPTVCLLSLLTYMTWYALIHSAIVPEEWYEGVSPATFSIKFAIAVLVISCPCALGLATPTAVMVGFSVGARNGVLIKSGQALEIASKVEAVIFDKTGTLTEGKPSITDFISEVHEDDELLLLWQLASLERNSEHPLAKAICNYAHPKLEEYLKVYPYTQPTDFKNETGRGASGKVKGAVVAIGNRSFARQMGVLITAETEDKLIQLEQDGKTAIFASIDGFISAVIGLADKLKPDALAAVSYLRSMHIDVWMVTGDNRRTAKAIGRALALPEDRIIAEALPATKLEHVKNLQESDLVVAMVGDGTNDAPGLAQADLGIGVGSGTEIAAEAADMVLVKGHVKDVCTAFDLSRVIFSRIRLNFLWSLLYNCLGIPVAAGLLYPWFHKQLPPTLAAICMALSSVSVVLSSLSLRLYRRPRLNRRPNRWIHSQQRQSPQAEQAAEPENEMEVNLLQHDHLAASEMTLVTDNRSNAV